MNECPICNSTMEDIHVFDSVPLSSAQLFNEFTTIEQTPMDLSICCNCNHVSNFNYQPSIYTNDNYVTKIASSTSMSANLQKIINFLNTTNKNVLEIGCGIGTDSINFARAGANLTIVELSEKSLEICKKRFEIFELNAIFYQGNCEELSSFLPLQKFDLIYFLYHL